MRQLLLIVMVLFIFSRIANRQCTAANVLQSPMPMISLSIGGLKLVIEVAATPESRARGLMFRKTLKANHGMLFVFPRENKLAFWMKNTGIPLSIIFVDKYSKVVSVKPLIPYSEKPVDSSKPAIYAIELNRTVCERNNIKPGMKVEGLTAITIPLQ